MLFEPKKEEGKIKQKGRGLFLGQRDPDTP